MNNQRLERVISYMRQLKLPQIIVSATASIYYLTDLWIDPHERMLALLLDDDGKATLFANTMFGLPENPSIPTVLHRDGENPVTELAAALRPGAIGIDKFWYSKFLIELMAQRADIVPVEGSAPVDLARQCKDAIECDAMRHSSKINDSVIDRAMSFLREGVSEQEVANLVKSEFLARGAQGEGAPLVCFGANCADPHHAADSTVLKPGDSIVFDFYSPIDRYWCDMTRTVFYKNVSEKQREVYDLVRRANEAAIAQVRPGVMLSHLDGTARKIIAEGGYGQYFTHRLGHGCGLECHEPPDVSGSMDAVLEPGMIFSIEPGIYLPGEFGVRIEDLVLVTQTGCEVLNRYSKDLQVVD